MRRISTYKLVWHVGRSLYGAALFVSCSINSGELPTLPQQSLPHGATIDEDENFIDGAIVEQVVIYPQESFDSPKQIERPGTLVRYGNAVGTVLICHGFMCDKHDTNLLRRLFPRGKFNIMNFDFRAHGQNSSNQLCTFGRDEAYDVIAAVKFLKNHPELQKKPILVYGFSMGAVAAIQAQSMDPTLFDGMILDCPFSSAESVIKKGLENLKFSIAGYTFELPGKSWLQRYAFHPYVQSLLKTILKTVARMDARDIPVQIFPINPSESIKNVHVPIFLILCEKDNRVGVPEFMTLYQNAGSPYKIVWITEGRGHFDSYFYNPERYTEKVRIFAEEVIRAKKMQKKNGAILHGTMVIDDRKNKE